MTIAIVASLTLLGCAHKQQLRGRRLTGTCDGACRYYLACKRCDDIELYRACVSECQEVFSDSTSLKEFESLRCPDLILYIEGPNGREPGSPPPGDSRESAPRMTEHQVSAEPVSTEPPPPAPEI